MAMTLYQTIATSLLSEPAICDKVGSRGTAPGEYRKGDKTPGIYVTLVARKHEPTRLALLVVADRPANAQGLAESCERVMRPLTANCKPPIVAVEQVEAPPQDGIFFQTGWLLHHEQPTVAVPVADIDTELDADDVSES